MCFTPISAKCTFVLSPSSSASPPSPIHPHSYFFCRHLFHPYLPHIHSQPLYVAFCFNPAFDISKVSVSLCSLLFQPTFHTSVVSLTITREGKNLTGARLGKHLTGTKGRKQLPLVFCFTPISDTSTLILSLSSSVSPPSPPHPHSSYICRLLFHSHLRHIQIHPQSVSLCVVISFASNTSIVSLSMSSSVSPPPSTYPQSASLCHLLFHPRLRHIHSQPLYVVFCFTPAFDISIVSAAMSSSVSPPPSTYP